MNKPAPLKFSSLRDAFPQLITGHLGDLDVEFDKIEAPESGQGQNVVFARDPESYLKALSRGVRAFVLSSKMKDDLGSNAGSNSYFFVSNVQLAFALASKKLFPDLPSQYQSGPDLHPTAVIDASASIAQGAKIGPFAVIGPRCKIESGVWIGPHAVIEGDVEIGRGSQIHAHVFVARRTQIGMFCDIKPGSVIGAAGYGYAHNEKGEHTFIQQLGRVVLEDHVDIGANCTIDRATFGETRIGLGTKLDNLIHIAHNCKIGKHCLLTGGFMSAGSATLGDHIVSGGRTSVTDHVQICSGVQLGGLSAVGKDITVPGAYSGYPLLPIKEHLKATASIAVLPKIRRDLARVMRHLGLKSEEE